MLRFQVKWQLPEPSSSFWQSTWQPDWFICTSCILEWARSRTTNAQTWLLSCCAHIKTEIEAPLSLLKHYTTKSSPYSTASGSDMTKQWAAMPSPDLSMASRSLYPVLLPDPCVSTQTIIITIITMLSRPHWRAARPNSVIVMTQHFQTCPQHPQRPRQQP